MKNLIKLSILFVLVIILGGCNKDDNSGQQDTGYAPKSVSSLTMNFDDIRINFHSNTSCSAVITYSSYYSVTSSSCNYKKTSENSATLSLNVAYHYFYPALPLEFDGTYDYQITLYFISPNEGYASGTLDGEVISDIHFTIFSSGENSGSVDDNNDKDVTGVKIINNSGVTLNYVNFYYTQTSSEIYTDNNASISNGSSKTYTNIPYTTDRIGVQVKKFSGENARWYQGFYLSKGATIYITVPSGWADGYGTIIFKNNSTYNLTMLSISSGTYYYLQTQSSDGLTIYNGQTATFTQIPTGNVKVSANGSKENPYSFYGEEVTFMLNNNETKTIVAKQYSMVVE